MTTVVVGAFEWDATKAKANARKHGVSFDEAARVFEDPFGLELADPQHADRWIRVGVVYPERILFVVYVEREDSGRIRIISARKATRHEKKGYEDR